MTPISAISQSSAPHANSSGWHSHDGILDPEIPGDTLVQVCFRDGDIAYGLVHDWDQNWQWAHSNEGLKAAGAIVAWRLHPTPGSTDHKASSMPNQSTDTDSRAEASDDHVNDAVSEETRRFNETMREKTPRQILAAVRLLMPRNKKPNWSLAMDVFCVGSTYGRRICLEAGIDPGSKTLTAFDVSTSCG